MADVGGVDIGRVGIWSFAHLWPGRGDVARELEQLGFGALWLGGSPTGDLRVAEELLDATSTLVVATGIVNIWSDDAATLAESYHRIARKHPDRFLLGVGPSHREVNQAYEKPYSALVSYVDELDRRGVPASRLVLAALGPKALRLAAERSAGAHPYLTTPEHTAQARAELGDGPLLAPELAAVPAAGPAAGTIAREYLKYYLRLTNYTNNFKRFGFTDEDFTGSGSDRLVDALIPVGPDAIRAKIREHHEAGADHVTVQLLTADGGLSPEAFRAIAP